MSGKDVFVDKQKLSEWLFIIGFCIAFFGSLRPWFLWPIDMYYPVLAAIPAFFALCLSHTMKNPVFKDKNWFFPLITYVILQVYFLLAVQSNVNAYIALSFNVILYMALFRIDKRLLPDLTRCLAKVLASILIVSIAWYFLYLLGFPLPSVDVDYKDGEYFFSNYYFFLLDDRFMFMLIPRFHSVFLEPSYLGTATVMLLMTQYGQWKKWYNIVLIIATFMTFSLEAYILFFILIFLNLWIMNKHVFAKAFISVAIVAAVVIGSFYYKDGDNLINQLIVIRLEVEDGEMAGDNRVDTSFQNEFDNLISSSDIIFGRGAFDETQYGEGNAGFRVFMFQYGLVGIILLLVFHLITVKNASYYKLVIAAFLIVLLDFIVRAYPLVYAVFLPYYFLRSVNGFFLSLFLFGYSSPVNGS